MKDTQEKQVGIWIRVFTEDQARDESPEHHEKRARYYAESKGWEVKEVYHLEAVIGELTWKTYGYLLYQNNPVCDYFSDDLWLLFR